MQLPVHVDQRVAQRILGLGHYTVLESAYGRLRCEYAGTPELVDKLDL